MGKLNTQQCKLVQVFNSTAARPGYPNVPAVSKTSRCVLGAAVEGSSSLDNKVFILHL